MKLPKRIVRLYRGSFTKHPVGDLGHAPMSQHDPAQQQLQVTMKQVAQAQADLEHDRQQLESERHMLQLFKLQLQAERAVITHTAEPHQLHQQELLLRLGQHGPVTAQLSEADRTILAKVTQPAAEPGTKPDATGSTAGGTALPQSFDPSLGPIEAAAAAAAAQQAVHQAIHDAATAAAAAAAAAATAQQYFHHLQVQGDIDNNQCTSATEPIKTTIAAPTSVAASKQPANDVPFDCRANEHPVQQATGGEHQHQHQNQSPQQLLSQGLASAAEQSGFQAAPAALSGTDAGVSRTNTAGLVINTSTQIAPGKSTTTIRTSLDNNCKPAGCVVWQSPLSGI